MYEYLFILEEKIYVSWAQNQHIMISERLCGTEKWSNAATNSAFEIKTEHFYFFKSKENMEKY